MNQPPISTVENLKTDNLKIRIEAVIGRVNAKLNLTKDNFLCFGASIQPNFLVWCSAMALHEDVGMLARDIVLRNAREEIFGLGDEGSHAMLAHAFFNQLGMFEARHYTKAKAEIAEIYMHLRNKNILLVFLACLELWSTGIMQKICEVMRDLEAADFKYIEVHQSADNLEDGHGVQFLEAIEVEKPTQMDIELALKLFENFCVKIFA